LPLALHEAPLAVPGIKPFGDKIALVCSESSRCTVSGPRPSSFGDLPLLLVRAGIELILQNVVVQNAHEDGFGGLLAVESGGAVAAVNVSFLNGTSQGAGGCVEAAGSVSCTDCSFEKCRVMVVPPAGAGAEQAVGGGIWSCGAECPTGGGLSLARPRFVSGACDDRRDQHPCGTGCFCLGDDEESCAGCTCHRGTTAAPAPYFYCNATGAPRAVPQ